MKFFYNLVLVLFVLSGFSQPPTNYYSTATASGYLLKTQLFNIINAHTEISYTPGLWNLYPTSDKRVDGKVWDIYSGCNFIFGTVASGGNQDNGTLGNVPCERFNREHTFPKSWFSKATPMYSDAFHVMPTDKKINSLRGNYCYGIVGNNTIPASYSTSCKLGNNVAPNGPNITVFEPADEYKGDVARNYFYMATCYENKIAAWEKNDSNGDAFLDGSKDKVYEQWALDMLFSWHLSDPVSAKEIERNNAVYAIQGNRNPFIDHPEYVSAIWSAVLSSTSIDVFSMVSVFPNPSNNHTIYIESEKDIDSIQLITVNGQLVQQIVNPIAKNKVYCIENLPQGFFFLKLTSNNQIATRKIMVN